jgi:polyisoprenyl-teichoic acid--peptidoglycan teichoic acid transferase
VSPPPDDDLDPRTQRRRKRRRGRSLSEALLLTAAGVVLPGTPHRAAGRRRLGALLDIGAAIIVIGIVTWVVTRSSQDLLQVAVDADALAVLLVAAGALAFLWPIAIYAGWLAVRPRQLGGMSRFAASAAVVVLCLAVAAPLVVASRYAYVQRDLVTTVFDEDTGGVMASGDDIQPEAVDPWADTPRVNVLLLGGDAGPDRRGLRTDTVILASIDTASGNAVLFSLPRNLERAPFPPGSELAKKYPQGFPDFLNAIYPTVADSPNLLAGVPDKGIRAVKDAVGQILGLPVDYYMMVDLEGFREVVDALGGITVNVKERLSYGAIRASGAIGRSQGYIEPGVQQMDGETALLYARSRDFSTDYDRMARQRCVVNAIVDKADPVTVFRSYPRIAASLREHLQTDIPAELLPAFVDLGDRVKAGTQTSVAFVPPLINSARPDFPLIRQTVADALTPVPPAVPAGEESLATPTIVPDAAPTRTATPTPTATATAPAQPANLDAVC